MFVKREIHIICLLLFHLCVYAGDKVVKIACVGNSITYGARLKNPSKDSYPGVLEQMLGKGYDVRNFGVSARTMLNKGDHPYMKEKKYKDALDFNPDIVIIKLGTNDSKPINWVYKSDFMNDTEMLINSFKSLSSKPIIILCLPVPSIPNGKNINNEVICNEIIPLLKKTAKKLDVEIFDFYNAMSPYYPGLFPDSVHPNARGAEIMAGLIYNKITGKKAPDLKSHGVFPGKKSKWKGFDRYDFVSAGRQATVVVPKKSAYGRPWIWRPAFFGSFSNVDVALLNEGFHVVYYDLTHLYGSPRSLMLGDVFYNRMVKGFKLSRKVVLEGLSRGGLFALKWAGYNPKAVSCVYVDAPVCDLTSWPGRQRNELWNSMLLEYGIMDNEVDSNFSGNAFDSVKSLAENKIPIVAVCGDIDDVVPFNENMEIFKDKFISLGFSINLILKPGVGHHPHGLDNPKEIVDFILRYSK